MLHICINVFSRLIVKVCTSSCKIKKTLLLMLVQQTLLWRWKRRRKNKIPANFFIKKLELIWIWLKQTVLPPECYFLWLAGGGASPPGSPPPGWDTTPPRTCWTTCPGTPGGSSRPIFPSPSYHQTYSTKQRWWRSHWASPFYSSGGVCRQES